MRDKTNTAMIPELRKVLKRLHYPLEVMLVCARWYATYPLSFRHLEEMMQERGVFVDHSTGQKSQAIDDRQRASALAHNAGIRSAATAAQLTRSRSTGLPPFPRNERRIPNP
jgi:transposase-like protein